METTSIEKDAILAFHPDILFFATESFADATRFVGSYSYNKNYQLALTRSPYEGNSFVYKTRARSEDRSTFRAEPNHVFLLGEVARSRILVAPKVKSSGESPKITRVSLKRVSDATKLAVDLFKRDAEALEAIVLAEADQRTRVASNWYQCAGIGSAYEAETIEVDCSCYSESIDGAVSTGMIILVDATMHRQDTYIHGTLSKVSIAGAKTRPVPITEQAYSLVAHRIHVFSQEDAIDAGFVNGAAATTSAMKALNISDG
ncbi:hypothetical protein B0H16DRAFT_1448575 [Mycena metata]|uniref:Uncharacterized protein n=1 Tax=Mycena metata TaxID=1033252 RepID=A0AAD7K608_9AGAR|nr:hypothetical protein B0H16DRAFT_1448575 [Mycena metata]